jgi:hypothetical protein
VSQADVFNVPCNWRNIVRWSGFKESVVPSAYDFSEIDQRPRVAVHDSDVLLRVQRLEHCPTKVRDWLKQHDIEHVTFGRFEKKDLDWRTDCAFLGVNFRLSCDSDATFFKMRWRCFC